MNDQHKWGSHPNFGLGWSKCKWCCSTRMYDTMPGWPGWYTYFTKEESYGPREGREPPPCIGDPQLSLPGIV